MPWTTPRTWVTSELVTASIMNVHVRDNLLALIADTCYAYHNTNQGVTAGNTTALNMNSEVLDTATMHDTVTNNTRVTVGRSGNYLVHGRSSVTGNNNGSAVLHLYKDGSALSPVISHPFTTTAADWEDQALQVTGIVPLSASQYLELRGQAISNDFTFTTTTLIVHGPLAAGN